MQNQTQDPALWFMNTRVKIVVPASTGDDRISVLKHWAPFQDSPPLHIHDSEDEVFHVLSGRIRFSVDGKPVILNAGDILMAPKGIPHSYIVESQEGAQWVTVTTGGDFEAMVRETSRPATAAGLPEAAHPTPEMIAAVDAACARNGIRLVGAPLAA